MKKKNKLYLSVLMVIALLGIGCAKVPAGKVGVMVDLYGSEKGVDYEVKGVGRHFYNPWTHDLFTYETFKQNYVWTAGEHEGSENDESIKFQDVDGLEFTADIGITYRAPAEHVGKLFETYRKGLDEITDTYLRNIVRDALNNAASTMKAEEIYGKGKAGLMKSVLQATRDKTKGQLEIENVYLIGSMRLPPAVKTAVNAKITATQNAHRVENEVAEKIAEAKKGVALAEGKKRERILAAEAAAEEKRMNAEAEANAIKIVTDALNEKYLKYQSIERWNGEYPTYLQNGGGAGTLIALPDAITK